MANKLVGQLERADEALAAGKLEQALAALVGAWAERPCPELLELVERFEQAHPPPPFEGDTKAFTKTAKKPSAIEMGSLARALVGPKSADTIERVRAVGAWAADPRVSRALEKLVREVPYTSDGTRPVWAEVFAVLVRIADPRMVALAKQLPGDWKFRENHREWLERQLTNAVAEIEQKRAKKPVAPLGDEERKAVEALAAKLTPAAPKKGEKTEEALLADIYARPFEDAPRLVYADWLLERGDPRGEFIVLQFKEEKSKAELKREAELLKANEKKWLGPLANVVLKDVEFRRGFVSTVVARFKHQRDVEQYGGAPEWATVERISWSTPGASSADQDKWLYFVPRHLHARAVDTAQAGLAQLLEAKAPWPIEELRVSLYDVELVRRFCESALFPKVQVLRVSGLPADAFASGWLSKVLDVGITELPHDLGAWLVTLSRLGRERFDVVSRYYGTLIFLKGNDGRLSVGNYFSNLRNVHSLVAAAKTIPDGWLTDLVLNDCDPELAKVLRSKVRAAGAPAPVVTETAPTISDKFNYVCAAAWVGDTWWVVEERRLVELDAKTGTPRREVPLNRTRVAAFSPDGKTLVSGADRRLEWRDTASGAQQHTETTPSNLEGLAFAPSGKLLMRWDEKRLSVIELPSKEVRAVTYGTYPNKAFCVAMSADGEWLAAGLYKNELALYAPGARRARKLAMPNLNQSMRFVGERLLFTTCRDGVARLFDVQAEADEPVATAKLEDMSGCLLSFDGKTIAVGSGKDVAFLDPRTLERRGALGEPLFALTFSPDSRKLLCRTKEGKLVVRDVP